MHPCQLGDKTRGGGSRAPAEEMRGPEHRASDPQSVLLPSPLVLALPLETKISEDNLNL